MERWVPATRVVLANSIRYEEETLLTCVACLPLPVLGSQVPLASPRAVRGRLLRCASVRGGAPQGIPEEMFLYFARSGARQGRYDLEAFRDLELRQAALAVCS